MSCGRKGYSYQQPSKQPKLIMLSYFIYFLNKILLLQLHKLTKGTKDEYFCSYLSDMDMWHWAHEEKSWINLLMKPSLGPVRAVLININRTSPHFSACPFSCFSFFLLCKTLSCSSLSTLPSWSFCYTSEIFLSIFSHSLVFTTLLPKWSIPSSPPVEMQCQLGTGCTGWGCNQPSLDWDQHLHPPPFSPLFTWCYLSSSLPSSHPCSLSFFSLSSVLTYAFSIPSHFLLHADNSPHAGTLVAENRVVQVHSSLSDCISTMRSTYTHRSLVWLVMGGGEAMTAGLTKAGQWI